MNFSTGILGREALKLIAALSFCIVTFVQGVPAQSVANYSGAYRRQGNVLTFDTGNGVCQLEFCTPGMLRVRTSRDRNFEPPEELMVTKYTWAPVTFQIKESEGAFDIESDQLSVRISKRPFGLSIYDRQGRLLSSDAQPAVFKEERGFVVTKELGEDEHFFGFGERMDFIDQRSKKLRLNVGRGKAKPNAIGAYNIQEANYAPVPFFMSTRGYGIFLHNSYATEWDMGMSDPSKYTFGAVGGELDYYFIYGPGFPVILDQYTNLTGKSPLIPRFALGLHAGTYSGGTWGHEAESSDKYVIEWARKFRELGIPIDLLWLDSTWRIFGKDGGKGATSFEWRETFQDPKAMFDSLYAMNYKMVGLHLRPRFDNGNKLNLLDQARERGLVYPEPGNKGEFVNFFDQKSVDWWWTNGVKRVADIGAKFLKTDEGSAFGGLANESLKTGPTDSEAQKLHNVFPLAYARAPYEKFQEYNQIRGLNQTREGYAGIQRYPFIFAGDWPSEWQYFAPVIRAGLNIGLSGVGYWSHCMGGFERVADPELFDRWVQFGMFSPIALLFGMEHPQYKEPWRYGEKSLANFIKYDKLRYRLMPYLYSSAWSMYKTGMPLMRALVLSYQDDQNVYQIDDQYLLGEDMLVCPVTTKGAQSRSVYLPEGEWTDFWNDKVYQGKQYIHLLCPQDQMPVFIKSGAIIPYQEDVAFTDEKTHDICFDIYPGRLSSFGLYEDDGLSLDYKNKKIYAITRISQRTEKDAVYIAVDKPEGKFKPADRAYTFRIHLKGRKSPGSVSLGGKLLPQVQGSSKSTTVGWHYEDATGILCINPGTGRARPFELQIK